MVMFLNNKFYEYASLSTSRDTIFGMYTQMIARNDIIYIHLHSKVIRGHKRSLEVTRSKKLTTLPRDTNFCMYTQLSIRSYIRHVSLILEVIRGHMRSQKL